MKKKSVPMNGNQRGEEQVEHGLVDREVEAAEVNRDPRVELELVLRLVLRVAPGRGDEEEERDGERDPRADRERDLLPGLEPREPLPDRAEEPHRAPPAGGSNGRMAIVIVSWSVKTRRNRTAAASPA